MTQTKWDLKLASQEIVRRRPDLGSPREPEGLREGGGGLPVSAEDPWAFSLRPRETLDELVVRFREKQMQSRPTIG
jgi:hypothetical protein